MGLPKIKICCISSFDEAEIAIAHGAAAIGLVGPMPSGPGVIDNNLICQIAQKVPQSTDTFLLTSEIQALDIIKHHQLCGTKTIQLVDAVTPFAYEQIRLALPNVKLVQVIHVLDEKSVDEALEIAELADALLLDSGNPNLDIKVLGGTGKTHNWSISRKIVEQSKVPVFLAGGINADNVLSALDQVQPYGLDLCSSVRTNKKLDVVKLEAFFKAAGY